MVQVFSYRPLTTEARFQSEASAVIKCVVGKVPLGQVYRFLVSVSVHNCSYQKGKRAKK